MPVCLPFELHSSVVSLNPTKVYLRVRFVGNAWAGPATVALKGGPRIKCNQLIIETCPWCPTLQSSLQVIASNEYSQQLLKERQQLNEDRDRTRDKLADTRLEVAALRAQLAQL